jgi:16S rRNA (cytosine967-C5)-methyltransferase
MQDAARITAVIEIITACETSWKTVRPLPADITMNRYFKERRYIGSKDRGAIAETAYYIIRHYGMLCWWVQRHQQSGATALTIAALLLHEKYPLKQLLDLFDGERFSPPELSPSEYEFAKAIAGKALLHPEMPDHVRFNYPQWVEENLRASLGSEWQNELEALNKEAPVDLRTNTLVTTRDELLNGLKKEGYKVEPCDISPVGIRMRTRAPIFTSEYFKRGCFEMQDEGSQIVSLLMGAKPGDKIIDFCAGAGGKTLALAASMQNKGRILAWDTSSKRLDQMIPRIKRAKADNIQRHIIESENDAFIKRHKSSADGVLIDAPCSGSGTWRRNPDLKWRFHEKDLQEILAIQQRILESASRLVKPGGHLLYITCSVLQSENERQIETFLQTHEKFRVVLMEKVWNNISQQTKKQGSTLRLTPHKDGTDGFFASLLQRCE